MFCTWAPLADDVSFALAFLGLGLNFCLISWLCPSL